MTKGKLGVIGGMGPEATLVFYQRVLAHTAADRDQDHIETLLLSDTQMPDRTAAILSGDVEPLYDRLLRDARLLENWGAACIVIPCNTSHTFVPRLQKELRVPIVNMIAETAAALKALGCKRVGILATDGTVHMGLYQSACGELGMDARTPPPEVQERVMAVIYDQVKAGAPVEEADLLTIDGWLRAEGCDRGVLACTELSVCPRWEALPGQYLDAMDVLARKCVEVCGYPLKTA